MNPKELGLAFCGDGLQYFVTHRFEMRRLKGLSGVTARQEVLVITKPNGNELVIRDTVIQTDKQVIIYRAKDAIYRYPIGERDEHREDSGRTI